MNILEEAQNIVQGDRRQEYGSAYDCFERISKMWSAYLGIPVDSFDVANLMIMLKICRAHKKGFQRSSYVDIAGYAFCSEIVYNDEQKIKGVHHEMGLSE